MINLKEMNTKEVKWLDFKMFAREHDIKEASYRDIVKITCQLLFSAKFIWGVIVCLILCIIGVSFLCILSDWAFDTIWFSKNEPVILPSIVVIFSIFFTFLTYYSLIQAVRHSKLTFKNAYDIENAESQYKIIRSKEGKFGLLLYKSKEGERLLLNSEYMRIIRCTEELFVINKNDKNGLYDALNNKFVLNCEYDLIEHLGAERFRVKQNQDEKKINRYGERVEI